MPALRLHDIDDAERFVSGLVSQRRLELRWHEREDLVEWLLGEAWRLSLDYRPGVIKLGFRKYAAVTLNKRIVDWQRQRLGRTRWVFRDKVHERARPTILSLDDGDNLDLLGGNDGEGSSDHALGWDTSLAGLLGTGDRTEEEDLETLGLRPPRRAA